MKVTACKGTFQIGEADKSSPSRPIFLWLIPLKLHWTAPDKIIELVERGGGLRDQESRLMLEQGIATGRGGVFLNLTYEQYTRLKSR